MKPPRPIFTAATVLVVLSTATFLAGARIGWEAGAGRFSVVVETAEELSRDAAAGVSDEQLAAAAIRGMLEALGDPYASVLSPREQRQVEDLLGGSIVGIGVWLERSEDGLLITSVVEGSPASRAELRPGDVIVDVDGTPVATLPDAAALLDGAPGTTVMLRVVREDGRPITVEIERERIELSSVRARLLEPGVGYAQLLQFGDGAAEELRGSVRRLLDEGAESLVLDLRGNPGGLADEAVGVASLFLDGGVVARLRERGAPERALRVRGRPLPGVPLVVLVNDETASASELVAGALQDRGRATLVGTTTFGKGSVLTVSDVGEGAPIQYTTAFFFTPSGRPIEGRGIEPDVPVLPGGPEDAQLDRAVEVLAG